MTPSPSICHSNNQSILQPQQEGSTFMGFAQSDGLTGSYRFTSPASNVNTTSFGLCHRKKKKEGKKNHLHWSLWSEQVALSTLQLETVVSTPLVNVRQAIYGLVGHLSAADKSFLKMYRHWPVAAIKERCAGTHACACKRAQNSHLLQLRLCIYVFSGEK